MDVKEFVIICLGTEKNIENVLISQLWVEVTLLFLDGGDLYEKLTLLERLDRGSKYKSLSRPGETKF